MVEGKIQFEELVAELKVIEKLNQEIDLVGFEFWD